MFICLSVVEFLRQSLREHVQSILAEDLFLREAKLWNSLAGLTFRCELLLNTKCSDVEDDASFLPRALSWKDAAARASPLLVQPIDIDDSFAAKFHAYSGIVQNTKGDEG